MNNQIPKFKLKLNEDNEIDFRLSIEGSVSDQDMAKPIFRFVMTENSSDRGWVFPIKSKSKGDDIFTVIIPALHENAKENTLYSGRLEVIMGNVLMVPTEVMMEFKKPLGIIAAPVDIKSRDSAISAVTPKSAVEKSNQAINSFDGLEEDIDAVIAAAPAVTRPAPPPPVSPSKPQAAPPIAPKAPVAPVAVAQPPIRKPAPAATIPAPVATPQKAAPTTSPAKPKNSTETESANKTQGQKSPLLFGNVMRFLEEEKQKEIQKKTLIENNVRMSEKDALKKKLKAMFSIALK